jgi:hypothetical protein
MKNKDKYHGQRDYTPAWNLDALRIELHTKKLQLLKDKNFKK